MPMPKPQAMEYTGTMHVSVRVIVAVPTTPSLLTKNVSTKANRASMPISSTMGMLNSTIARRTPIAV